MAKDTEKYLRQNSLCDPAENQSCRKIAHSLHYHPDTGVLIVSSPASDYIDSKTKDIQGMRCAVR